MTTAADGFKQTFDQVGTAMLEWFILMCLAVAVVSVLGYYLHLWDQKRLLRSIELAQPQANHREPAAARQKQRRQDPAVRGLRELARVIGGF